MRAKIEAKLIYLKPLISLIMERGKSTNKAVGTPWAALNYQPSMKSESGTPHFKRTFYIKEDTIKLN